MKAQGTVFKYGDNVDTDVIIPARYLNIADPAELATHAMEDIDADFVKNMKPGDIIVATKNFGCGSSREHAPRVIKDNGVACVIASSFARIFYRNAINIGLPILECAEAAEAIEAGDEVAVDFSTGVIENLTTGATFQALPFPEFIQNIIDHDGLFNALKARAQADADAVAHAVAAALRPSDELLTVITGRNAGRDVGALAASAAVGARGQMVGEDVEVAVHAGGQERPDVLIAIE